MQQNDTKISFEANQKRINAAFQERINSHMSKSVLDCDIKHS